MDAEPAVLEMLAAFGKACGKELPYKLRLRLMYQAVQGMLFLHNHSPPIIHRDLKSCNVLLDGGWTAKLSDFGVSKSVQPFDSTMTMVGTPLFAAPEVLTTCTQLGESFCAAEHWLTLFTMMIAQVLGYEARDFVHCFGDTHLYSNHIEQAQLQLTRDPRPLPTMRINPEVRDIDAFCFEYFTLENYDPHPHIKAEVSV